MADYGDELFYIVARIKLLIPLERELKSNISFIFYFFDIIINKKVTIKRILFEYLNKPQDGYFLFPLSTLAYVARHLVLLLYSL